MDNRSAKPSPLRRRYLVNRPMQLTYSGVIVWMVGIAMVVAWLVTYYTIWSLVLNRVPQGAQLPSIIQDVNLRLFWTLLIPGFILLVLVGWSQVFMLHRVAGPAYRLRKTMTDMTQGQWPESVKVRDRDFLKDIVEEFNLLIASEGSRYAELGGRLKEAADILDRLEGANETEKERIRAGREALNAALALLNPVLPTQTADEDSQAG